MAVTTASFKARFTEFDLDDYTDPAHPVANTVQDALVTQTLAGAEAQTDRTLFPTIALADEAVMYLTAHLLARSLPALNARLQKSRGDDNLHTGEDVYWPVYERIARSASSGYRST